MVDHPRNEASSKRNWIAGAALGAAAAIMVGAAVRRRAYTFVGRTVLITGGSRGLGLELAREFAREGANLALLARDAEALARAGNELAARGAEVLTVACDLRDQGQIDRAVQQVMDHFGRIDVIVNNAGVIQSAPYEHLSRADFEKAMDVHFYGALDLTRAALPHLRAAGDARIINIASIGGKIAVPHLLAYSASKFALVGLSHGLRSELSREGIKVTTVCPGLMRTGSPRHALFKGQHEREYAWFAVADSLPILSMNARRAARRILAAARAGEAEVVLGWPAKLAVLMDALLPSATATLLSGANRLLPEATSGEGDKARRGHESESAWTESPLTQLSQQAAQRNNEGAVSRS